jgi:hypothetical protein
MLLHDVDVWDRDRDVFDWSRDDFWLFILFFEIDSL